MTPEQRSAQEEKERLIAVQQDEIRQQRNEERARIRQERLYSRSRGR